MTKITYDRDDLSVRAEGHSGYEVAGKDIVCASVSALMLVLGLYADKLGKKGKLRKAPKISYKEAESEVSIEIIGLYKREAREVFDVVCEGFERLSREYKDNVSYERIWEGV